MAYFPHPLHLSPVPSLLGLFMARYHIDNKVIHNAANGRIVWKLKYKSNDNRINSQIFNYYCVSKPKFRKNRGRPARREELKSQTFIVNQKHKKTLAAIKSYESSFVY